MFGARARKQYRRQRPWWLLRPLSFRSVVLLLLLLCVLLAFGPTFLFRLLNKQRLVQKCSWLRNRPLVCAHGGDTTIAPPNTFAAFERALQVDADCVEIDVSCTQDGVLVALHDRDLQNIYGNDHIRVGDLLYAEVSKLDAGCNFAKEFQNQLVPSLLNALQVVSSGVKQVIIDAKLSYPMFGNSFAADILRVVNLTQCKNCLVWSKSDSLVKELKRLSPELMAGYIVMKDGSTGRILEPTRIKSAEVVGAYHGAVDAEMVHLIHSVGKKIYAWTVDERESMAAMLSDGVDGIVTSHPRMLQEVMTDLERQCLLEGYSP